MRKNSFWLLTILIFSLVACNNGGGEEGTKEGDQEINVYSHRHYDTDKMLFKKFEEETGIKVNVVEASADELLERVAREGELSPADVIITVDAGRLHRAKTRGLLQPIESAITEDNVPEQLWDKDKNWVSVTKRARIVVYSKDRVKPEELSTYEDLTNEKWKGRILVRGSGNIYNQSLLASIIANDGEEAAKEWATGMVANFARDPEGNDRGQVKAIAQGVGDVAIVNTYYIGKLLNAKNDDGSADEEQIKAGEAVGLFFPNSDQRGTHINVSGIGLAKYAPNKDNAHKFIEFLTGVEAQNVFGSANYEYPVNPKATVSDLLQSWGDFNEDKLDLSKLGELNEAAVKMFDEVGWK